MKTHTLMLLLAGFMPSENKHKEGHVYLHAVKVHAVPSPGKAHGLVPTLPAGSYETLPVCGEG